MILVQKIRPIGILNEEIGVKTAKKFSRSTKIRRLVGVTHDRQCIRAEAQKRPRHPGDAAGHTNGGSSRIACKEFIAAGTAQSDGNVLPRFLGQLMHQIRGRIGERLVKEFDEIKDFEKIRKFQRQFEVFGSEVTTDVAGLFGLSSKKRYSSPARASVYV